MDIWSKGMYLSVSTIPYVHYSTSVCRQYYSTDRSAGSRVFGTTWLNKFDLADFWRRCGAQDPTYTSNGVILVYLECSMELGVCGLLLEQRWRWRCRQCVDGIIRYSVW